MDELFSLYKPFCEYIVWVIGSQLFNFSVCGLENNNKSPKRKGNKTLLIFLVRFCNTFQMQKPLKIWKRSNNTVYTAFMKILIKGTQLHLALFSADACINVRVLIILLNSKVVDSAKHKAG